MRSPVGDGWMLSADEKMVRAAADIAVAAPAAPARLLPSGDTYFLLWGRDRALLLPDAAQRARLWTTRVWPGALLVNGDVVGVCGGPRTASRWTSGAG